MISIKRIMFYKSGRGREAVHEREDAADASQALDARKARSSAPADGPVATVRNAGPVAVTPVGLHAIRWMGLWPSSAMVVALELLERKRHSMGTRSTTMMIAICSFFRRTSRSMRRRTQQRPPTKAWRAQKPLIASLRRSSAACFFSFLCRLCLTRRFGLLCRKKRLWPPTGSSSLMNV